MHKLIAMSTTPSNFNLLEQVLANCGDCFDEILSFLYASDLLNLVSCQKKFLQQLRYEHVIRSSYDDGYSYDESYDIKVQVERIKRRTIWVPTPLRMLRLAKYMFYCECDLCIRRPPSKPGERDADESFGLAVCVPYQRGVGGCIKYQKSANLVLLPKHEHKRAHDRILEATTFAWDGQSVRDALGYHCGPYLSESEWNIPNCESLYYQRVSSDPNAKFTEEIVATFARWEREYKDQYPHHRNF